MRSYVLPPPELPLVSPRCKTHVFENKPRGEGRDDDMKQVLL